MDGRALEWLVWQANRAEKGLCKERKMSFFINQTEALMKQTRGGRSAGDCVTGLVRAASSSVVVAFALVLDFHFRFCASTSNTEVSLARPRFVNRARVMTDDGVV